MATVFVGKNAKAAYSYDVDAGIYTLQTDKSVKTSNHVNKFKDKETMTKYLNWLFGEGKWNTCGTEVPEEKCDIDECDWELDYYFSCLIDG